jgi:hypothetical protein
MLECFEWSSNSVCDTPWNGGEYTPSQTLAEIWFYTILHVCVCAGRDEMMRASAGVLWGSRGGRATQGNICDRISVLGLILAAICNAPLAARQSHHTV